MLSFSVIRTVSASHLSAGHWSSHALSDWENIPKVWNSLASIVSQYCYITTALWNLKVLSWSPCVQRRQGCTPCHPERCTVSTSTVTSWLALAFTGVDVVFLTLMLCLMKTKSTPPYMQYIMKYCHDSLSVVTLSTFYHVPFLGVTGVSTS